MFSGHVGFLLYGSVRGWTMLMIPSGRCGTNISGDRKGLAKIQRARPQAETTMSNSLILGFESREGETKRRMCCDEMKKGWKVGA